MHANVFNGRSKILFKGLHEKFKNVAAEREIFRHGNGAAEMSHNIKQPPAKSHLFRQVNRRKVARWHHRFEIPRRSAYESSFARFVHEIGVAGAGDKSFCEHMNNLSQRICFDMD